MSGRSCTSDRAASTGKKSPTWPTSLLLNAAPPPTKKKINKREKFIVHQSRVHEQVDLFSEFYLPFFQESLKLRLITIFSKLGHTGFHDETNADVPVGH